MTTFNITGNAAESDSFTMVVSAIGGDRMTTAGAWEVTDAKLDSMRALAACMAELGAVDVDVVIHYCNA